MEPKISVVIPVYNVEQYLHQCLDSVVNQTYENLEILLIDDGSPDNCGVICDEYAAKDERITVLHKANGGVSAARNDGVKIAAGEWITFVDPDDWLEPDYYEMMIKEVGDIQTDVFSSGGAFMEYARWTKTARRIKRNYYYTKQRYDEQRETFLAKDLMRNVVNDDFVGELLFDMPWNNLYNATFVAEHKFLFDTELHPLEDTLFNFMAFDQASSVAGCSYIGYHYRQSNEASSTKRYQSEAFPELCVFLDKINSYRRSSLYCSSARIDDALAARALAEFIRCLRNYYFHKDVRKPRRAIAKELKAAKQDPRFRWTYRRRSNRYLTKGTLCIKYALRMPCIWPLRVSYKMISLVIAIKMHIKEKTYHSPRRKVCKRENPC